MKFYIQKVSSRELVLHGAEKPDANVLVDWNVVIRKGREKVFGLTFEDYLNAPDQVIEIPDEQLGDSSV